MRISFVLSATIALAGCLFGQAAPAAAPAPETDGLFATIKTSAGNIKLRLFEKESPITVRNFIGLATGRKAWTHPNTGARTSRPLYTGTIFHRVIPGFMIQGGDPTGTGQGGTDVIKDEFDPTLKFDIPGRIAMANAGPGTGSCQFFITEVPTPHLNGRHTIFGQVVDNQALVPKIANVPRDANNRPAAPVKILGIDFERIVGGKPAPVTPSAAPARKATTVKKTATKTTTKTPAKTPAKK